MKTIKISDFTYQLLNEFKEKTFINRDCDEDFLLYNLLIRHLSWINALKETQEQVNISIINYETNKMKKKLIK